MTLSFALCFRRERDRAARWRHRAHARDADGETCLSGGAGGLVDANSTRTDVGLQPVARSGTSAAVDLRMFGPDSETRLPTMRRMSVTTRAGLAGIGAVLLTSAVLTGITVELWFLRIVVTDGPPPRVDALLLLKWFAGAFIAARLGGMRAVGIVALYALALAAVTIFQVAGEAPLQCALVPRPNCSTSLFDWIGGTPWVMEGLAGQLWTIPGFLLGALAARMSRVSVPLGAGLAALSVFAIGIVVANYATLIARYTVCFSSDFVARCIDPEYLFWFAAHIALGAIASVVLVRLGGEPRHAVILGGVLFVSYLPGPVHQIAMIAGDGLPAVLGNLGAIAGVLTFVLLSFRAQRGKSASRQIPVDIRFIQ